MSTVTKPHYTPEQYLAIERTREYKSEYYAGEMFAMAGGTEGHSLIATNVARILGNQLLDRPCRVYNSDMRIRISANELYTYPDLTVICGKPEFHDALRDTLLNPTALIEVLSPSTESYDRGKKFEFYRKLESLKQYVLVAQDHYLIECYSRNASGNWVLTEANAPDQTLTLDAIGCQLQVAEVYAKVEFPQDAAGGESNVEIR